MTHPVDTHWHDVQSVLGDIYSTQIKVAHQQNKPLFDCNVVVEDYCGYSIALETYLTEAMASYQNKHVLEAWNEQRRASGKIALINHYIEVAESQPHAPSTLLHSPNQGHHFHRVALGGTFDHLHAGHKILLTMAALMTESSLVVGVTDDSMLSKKQYKEYIESTDKRIERVQSYLNHARRTILLEVVPICDPSGPTITDATIDCLVCSKETLPGGHAVNHEREKRHMSPLALRVIDLVSSGASSMDESTVNVNELKISSTWIRDYLANNPQ
ncbi:hypothetical protein BDF14DRAFT_1887035 [Spinellus fusiger]|nr:hypothetical protein BDF14DRAFT_1887035 [Spinellus fusiger]